jgi:uncharacterized protein (DUF1684 family)
MKYLIVLLVALSACTSSDKWTGSEEGQKDFTPYEQKVQNYHDSISAVYMSGMNNVIPKDEINPLNKLSFFTPNEKFAVKATFEKIEGGEKFKMITSTDRLPEYLPYGKLNFSLNGENHSLTLYFSEENPESLFCPFKDLTNGLESYGAGRYLDFSISDTISPTIDFNYCYNPYCAYNPRYSCPIPPSENHLRTRIEAGVKKWH